MNTKENWLIAWSITRTYKRENHFPRQTKGVYKLLSKAQELFGKRVYEELIKPNSLVNRKIESYLNTKKGFKKEWTGHKWTWVKIEESDVPF